MGRFAKAGIGAGKRFDIAMFSPEQRQAIEPGAAAERRRQGHRHADNFIRGEAEAHHRDRVGLGLNPDKDAIYLNAFPERNDGTTLYSS